MSTGPHKSGRVVGLTRCILVTLVVFGRPGPSTEDKHDNEQTFGSH
jgi:hypothetical protein